MAGSGHIKDAKMGEKEGEGLGGREDVEDRRMESEAACHHSPRPALAWQGVVITLRLAATPCLMMVLL